MHPIHGQEIDISIYVEKQMRANHVTWEISFVSSDGSEKIRIFWKKKREYISSLWSCMILLPRIFVLLFRSLYKKMF